MKDRQNVLLRVGFSGIFPPQRTVIGISHCLEVKFKIVKREYGANVGVDDEVSPVNFLLHSLFWQVEIHYNRKSVSTPYTFYPYKAYVEKHVNYDKNLKDTIWLWIIRQGWGKKMDDHDATVAAANSGLEQIRIHTEPTHGWTERESSYRLSQTRTAFIESSGHPHPIIPEWTRVLPHDTRRRQYTLKMVSARMKMVKIGLHSSVLNRNNQALSTKNAKWNEDLHNSVRWHACC